MPSTDEWYVRLPDGRVMYARSSAAVRHHLETGQLPRDVQVRRTPRDHWAALERFDVFADLALPHQRLSHRKGENHSPGSHPHLQLETVGVRGFLDHLWTALDATLQPARLRTAALLGGGGGVALTAISLAAWLEWPWSGWVALAAGLAFWLLQGWAVVVQTRLTFLELSERRLPTWREATNGLARQMTRLLLAQLLVGLVVGGLLAALRLPVTLTLPEHLSSPLRMGGTVLRLGLETLLWGTLGLGFLLPPVLVVEDCSVWSAFRQWVAFLRQHLGRVLLYESLVLAMAAVLALPWLLLVAVTAWSADGGEEMVSIATLTVLGSLALTPALAFLLGVNVFIYVHLRYEVGMGE